MLRNELGLSTLAAWGGEQQPHGYGAAQVPIVQSAPFAYPDVASWRAVIDGDAKGDIYSRNTNPTVAVFEEKCRLMEGGESAIAFASGMAAISNTLFAVLRAGDHVVSIKDAYGATSRIFMELLEPMGVTVTLVSTDDADALEAAVRAGCRLVYVETPTNPTLKVIDLHRMAAAARSVGALLMVDNTFASPINTRPIALGADLVVHSATKFLGGHDDAIGGVLVGRRDLVDTVYRYREITGAALAPFAAYLLLRGMKTLALRVERQNATALAVAQHLERDPRVAAVFYPGLASHPSHHVAAKQMSGFGGVLSFEMVGGEAAAIRLLDALKLVHRAASLGSVNTLAGLPGMTSHVEVTPQDRAALGIPEALIRYSCGIEDATDLIDDLDRALASLD
ncbi:aminotransferase class I/II-fold pyridoxal phosphate-dependent enzyme [Novosphingobium sp.]|uniref:aminotransferase class I/II-fold pyridoxal phosphate-dependent enzyme n=1 Tax=Novosphingobium sp. TaxID=1874826 RepID=UPI0033428071